MAKNMTPEWCGSIFTSENPLSNDERLALWLFKRAGRKMFFNYWRRGWWR